MQANIDHDERQKYLIEELDFLLQYSGLPPHSIKSSDIMVEDHFSVFHVLRINLTDEELANQNGGKKENVEENELKHFKEDFEKIESREQAPYALQDMEIADIDLQGLESEFDSRPSLRNIEEALNKETGDIGESPIVVSMNCLPESNTIEGNLEISEQDKKDTKEILTFREAEIREQQIKQNSSGNQPLLENVSDNSDVSPSKTQQKPKLLFLHGYGMSAIYGYRFFLPLAKRFEIVAADLPGMGFNSRPETPFNSGETCIKYFVDELKKLVDGLGWTKFSLAGHSLGGFLAAHFFNHHSSMIEKLYLISPGGLVKSNELSDRQAQQRLNEKPFLLRKVLKRCIDLTHVQKKSPLELQVPLFKQRIMDAMLRRFFNEKRFTFSTGEKDGLFRVMRYQFLLPQSGERCLGHLFSPATTSDFDIISLFQHQKDRLKDVSIFFGTNDWMDYVTTFSELRKANLQVIVHMVDSSDHHIPLQNPTELADMMINEIDGGAEFTPVDYMNKTE